VSNLGTYVSPCARGRYDTDKSNSVNTYLEFHSLTLNLLFKIGARKPPRLTEDAVTEKIDAILQERGW
jgi:hypothetical protein